jgi:hypothetical protein
MVHGPNYFWIPGAAGATASMRQQVTSAMFQPGQQGSCRVGRDPLGSHIMVLLRPWQCFMELDYIDASRNAWQQVT